MKSEVVQIVKQTSGGIVLDVKTFAKLLEEANIGDRKVAVISICGEYGKGKSFLAKILLQYLKYPKHKDQEDADDWLEGVGGDSVETDEPGIYLYRQVFTVDNVAVLLMHVQGTHASNGKITSQLFALACMLSSVQILNFRTQLQGSDLVFTKDFVEIVSTLGVDLKVLGRWNMEFQILVRDWPHGTEMDFGFTGGMKYLDHILQSGKFGSDSELGFMKSRLSQMFQNVRCFLMPHPGLGIRDKNEVEIDDLGLTFVQEAQTLAKELLSKATVRTKAIRGKELTGKSLLNHAENCMKAMKNFGKKTAKKDNGRPTPSPRNKVPKPPRTKQRKNYLKPEPISEHGPVKVIDIQDNDVQLHAEEFERILGQKEIGDKPIAIISIAGAFRRGKSFILNFFLRYMRNKGYLGSGNDWMGDPNKPIADGFEWSGGIEPHTSGIMIYSEPFIVQTQRGEVAVLFMDTQGLFDSNTTEEKNMRIFAFNTLISSVQILNVSMNLDEQVLNFLQFFTAYAKRVTEKESGEFLQSLKFLIRDWQNTMDFRYGSEGGEAYIENYMKTHGKSAELRAVRQYISSAFQSIGCFLMPHPGFELQKLGFKKATLSDVREEFVKQITPLVSSILHPDNLEVKVLHGKPMTAQALYATATRCVEAFGSVDFKVEVDKVLDIIAEARMGEIRKEYLERYSEKMEQMAKNCSGAKELKGRHGEAKKFAFERQYSLRPYEKRKKLDACIKHADREMDSCFARFVAEQEHSKAKTVFEVSNGIQDAVAMYQEKMNTLEEQPIPPEEFDEFHEKCWQEVKATFEQTTTEAAEAVDAKNLEKEKTKVYEVHREQNKIKYELYIHQLEMANATQRHSDGNPVDKEQTGNGRHTDEEDASLKHAVKDLVKKHQEKIKDQNGGRLSESEISKSASDMYRSAHKSFKSSGKPGHFKRYIQLLEKELSAVKEPTKIAPDKGRLQNIRLKRFVNESVQLFDADTRNFRSLYVGQAALTQFMQIFAVSAIKIFDHKTENEEPTEALHRHRLDLQARLEAKKELLFEENTRNLGHYNRAREEMGTKAAKLYHDRMDQLLKSGYIVEGKLKRCHAEICSDVLGDMNADDLPIYVNEGDNRSDDINFKNLIKSTEKKLDGFYNEKKFWNKKNHGIVVRALANLLY